LLYKLLYITRPLTPGRKVRQISNNSEGSFRHILLDKQSGMFVTQRQTHTTLFI